MTFAPAGPYVDLMRIEFVDVCQKCGFVADELVHLSFVCPLCGRISVNQTLRVMSLTEPGGARTLVRFAS